LSRTTKNTAYKVKTDLIPDDDNVNIENGALYVKNNDLIFHSGGVKRTIPSTVSKVDSYQKTVSLDVVGKGTGGTKTVTVIVGNALAERIGIGDELYLYQILDGDYVSGDITVNLDFIPLVAEAGKEVQFQLDYTTHDDGEVVGDTTGTLTSGDINVSATQYMAQDYSFTIPLSSTFSLDCG